MVNACDWRAIASPQRRPDANQRHMVEDRVVPDQVKCFVSVSVHDGGDFQAYKKCSNLPKKCGRKAPCDKDCCDGV